MPSYLSNAVIIVLSAVVSTQAFAQGKADESNGVPHVIQEALANGINVEVTNSPTVTVENQVDVAVVGETEVVVTNASPIEVTVSNFPDTSGGGGDESGYLGLSSVGMTGAGGLTGKVMQCQSDFGPAARMCSDAELVDTPALTKAFFDGSSIGVSRVWVKPKFHSFNVRSSANVVYSAGFASGQFESRYPYLAPAGVCVTDQGRRPPPNSDRSPRGVSLNLEYGFGSVSTCDTELHVACCR